jgi:hypothetical protein
MWYKPPQALAGPGDIGIPKTAQENFLDFEVATNQSPLTIGILL